MLVSPDVLALPLAKTNKAIHKCGGGAFVGLSLLGHKGRPQKKKKRERILGRVRENNKHHYFYRSWQQFVSLGALNRSLCSYYLQGQISIKEENKLATVIHTHKQDYILVTTLILAFYQITLLKLVSWRKDLSPSAEGNNKIFFISSCDTSCYL